MSLLAGALFGVVRGLFLVVFNASAGASSCYFLSKMIGRPIVNWLWPEKLRYFQGEVFVDITLSLFFLKVPQLQSKFINSPVSLVYDGCELLWFQIAKRRDKLLNYMLFLRVTPTLPNLFINLASPIVDIPFHTFFLATVIGLIPAAYITVRVRYLMFLALF